MFILRVENTVEYQLMRPSTLMHDVLLNNTQHCLPPLILKSFPLLCWGGYEKVPTATMNRQKTNLGTTAGAASVLDAPIR